MGNLLVEWDTGDVFGPASKEAEEKYEAAVKSGCPYFLYPFFGYQLKMTIRTGRPSPGQSVRQGEVGDGPEKG